MRSKAQIPSQCDSRKTRRGRITKLTSVYGDTLTCSKFGNLTGTYPGIQAAFYEPGGEPQIPRPS